MADPNHLFPNIGMNADDNQSMASNPLIAEHPGPQQQEQHLQLQQPASGNEAGTEGEANSHKRTYQACVSNHSVFRSTLALFVYHRLCLCEIKLLSFSPWHLPVRDRR